MFLSLTDTTFMRLVKKIIAAVLLLGVVGCNELFGTAKVSPVISRGSPLSALQNPADMERVSALVPADGSYSNRQTSASFQFRGACISGTVAVMIAVGGTDLKVTVACDSTSGEFNTKIDLSGLADGPISVKIGYIVTLASTGAVFEVVRGVVKDTVEPATFSIPSNFTEANYAINLNEVADAVSYAVTFSPNGGGPPIVVDSATAAIPVIALNAGTTYTVSVVASDLAGNTTSSSNNGTFTKTDTTPPSFTSLALTDANGSYINDSEKKGSASALIGPLIANYYDTVKYGVGLAATACSAMQFGTSIPTTADMVNGDGTYKVCVELKDNAGNTTYGSSATIVLDTSAPTFNSVSLDNVVAADGFINDSEKALTSSELADSLSGSYDTAQYAVGLFATACSAMEFGDSIPTPADMANVDGTYKVCVKLSDYAENVTYGSSSSFIRDTFAPTASQSGAPTGTSSTTTLNVTVAGTGVTHYKYKVGVSASVDCTNSASYSAQTIVATKITDDILGLADGGIKLCIVGRDAAGNWQTYSSANATTWTKGASGGSETNQLVYFNTASGEVDHLIGNPGGIYAFTNIRTTSATVLDAALTLDGNNWPWIAVVEDSSTAFLNILNTYLYLSTAQYPSATEVISKYLDSIPSASTAVVAVKNSGNYLVNTITGGIINVTDKHAQTYTQYYDTNLASVETSTNVLEPTNYYTNHPVPGSYSVATDSAYTQHLIFTNSKSGYPQNWYYKRTLGGSWDGGSWDINPVSAAANQSAAYNMSASNSTTNCIASSYPNMAIDSNDKVHYVYYCNASGINEVVHADNTSGSWSAEVVASVAVTPPSATKDSRMGFAIDTANSNALHVVWWDGSKNLQYRRKVSGVWGSTTQIESTNAGADALHTPQVGVYNGKVRVYFVATTYTSWSADLKVWYDTGSGFTTAVVKSFSSVYDSVYLGNGLGINGVAGNSHR